MSCKKIVKYEMNKNKTSEFNSLELSLESGIAGGSFFIPCLVVRPYGEEGECRAPKKKRGIKILKILEKKNGLRREKEKKMRRKRNHKGKKKKERREKNLENWVEMEEVLKWLKKHQVQVDKNESFSNAYEKENSYIYLNRRVSAFHILRLANEIRVKNKREPFLVEGVTF